MNELRNSVENLQFGKSRAYCSFCVVYILLAVLEPMSLFKVAQGKRSLKIVRWNSSPDSVAPLPSINSCVAGIIILNFRCRSWASEVPHFPRYSCGLWNWPFSLSQFVITTPPLVLWHGICTTPWTCADSHWIVMPWVLKPYSPAQDKMAYSLFVFMHCQADCCVYLFLSSSFLESFQD